MQLNRTPAVLFTVCLLTYIATSFAQPPAPENARAALDNSSQPLVIYYSRTGKAQTVAAALASRVPCDYVPIVSKRSIGIMTITLDQFFNRDDEQEPFCRDLANYNPLIIVSPIWFMKLSSPVRTFLQRHPELRGKDIYIITTSGGPMEKRNAAVAEYAKAQGLNVRGVFNISGVMRKNKEDLEADVKMLIEKNLQHLAAPGTH